MTTQAYIRKHWVDHPGINPIGHAGYGIDKQGKVWSPAFWRDSTTTKYNSFCRPPNRVNHSTRHRVEVKDWIAGPFADDEIDMARKMMKEGQTLKLKGGKWWIVKG